MKVISTPVQQPEFERGDCCFWAFVPPHSITARLLLLLLLGHSALLNNSVADD